MRTLPFSAFVIAALFVGGCDDDADLGPDEAREPVPGIPGAPTSASPIPSPGAQPEAAREPTSGAAPPHEEAAAKASDEAEDSATEPAGAGDSAPSTDASRRGAKRRTVAKLDTSEGRKKSEGDPDLHDTEPGLPASIQVRRLVLARGVEEREPTGTGTSFVQGDDERIYAFLELDNPEKIEGQVAVVFAPPAGAPYTVKLNVGAHKRWRTWAFTRKTDEVGDWSVVVEAPDGRELSKARFEITPND